MDKLNAIQQYRVNEVMKRVSGLKVGWYINPMPDLSTFAEMFNGVSTPTQDLCTLAVIINEDAKRDQHSKP